MRTYQKYMAIVSYQADNAALVLLVIPNRASLAAGGSSVVRSRLLCVQDQAHDPAAVSDTSRLKYLGRCRRLVGETAGSDAETWRMGTKCTAPCSGFPKWGSETQKPADRTFRIPPTCRRTLALATVNPHCKTPTEACLLRLVVLAAK